MTRNKSTYLALIAVLMSPMAANADLIDFESLASPGSTFVDVGNAYSEDGYQITNLSCSGPSCLRSAESGNSTYYAGSAALLNNTVDGVTELRAIDGSLLNIFSIDLTEVDVNRLGPTSVAFTGNVFGGGTVEQTFDLDGVFGFETFLFSGFAGLTSLTWTQTPQFHQFDNIVVNNKVPEPGTLALLGIGIFGMSLVRRRRAA